MRSDPTDNGGLFVGRRPGTAPLRYRTAPDAGDPGRRRRDAFLAACVLGVMVLIAVLFWGPIPVGWLWIVSHVGFLADHVFLALVVAFFGILLTLLGGLVLLKHLDRFWILVRRASGVEQRDGVVGRVFLYSAMIGATLFSAWLILGGGLADSITSGPQ